MSDKTKTQLIPKLRFLEFREATGWMHKTLGEICFRITNGKANAQDHEDDGEYPLFDRSAVIKRSSEFVFDAEAVIIPGEGVRFIPKYFRGKFNLHQRAYALMDHQGDARFVYYFLDHHQDVLAKKAVQSTVLSLRLPIVENFVIGAPIFSEQKKIADCLSSLDELIAAQVRKVDALKTHRKGLMQRLFPREGETQPRLRFPEFRDMGDWELKSLAEFVEIASGQINPTQSPYSGLPQIGSENIESNTGKLVNVKSAADKAVISGNYVFDENDVLYSKIRPALNKVAVPDFTGICSADIYPIRPANRGLLRSYLVYLLLSTNFLEYAIRNSERGKIPKINRSGLLAYESPIPIPDEQQRIAEFLTALDDLITAVTQGLATLKAHKKGLMQQLFPSAEAVEA